MGLVIQDVINTHINSSWNRVKFIFQDKISLFYNFVPEYGGKDTFARHVL